MWAKKSVGVPHFVKKYINFSVLEQLHAVEKLIVPRSPLSYESPFLQMRKYTLIKATFGLFRQAFMFF